MFTVEDKAKPGTENIRDLNLVVVKFMTVQVTKLLLWHKIHKIGMICFAKPGLVYRAKARIFNNMLYVRYVHLMEGQAHS
jgi:hypothetical protein